MLVQLMPVSGGLAASQLASSSTQSLAVFRLPGQPVRPAEREPVLVPIQLPDDFVIAAGGVQVSHPGVETAGWTTIVNRVVRPVGCAAGTEAQRVIPEQIVLPRRGSDRHGRPPHVRCQEIRGAGVRRGTRSCPR